MELINHFKLLCRNIAKKSAQNQQFNNVLYIPGKITPSLRFKTLKFLAFWFIKNLSAVRRLFACGSDFKILTFSQSTT